MRKVIIFVSFAIFFLVVFFGVVSTANACVDWCPPSCSTGEPIGACSGYYTYDCCDGGSSVPTDCDPLHYGCNDASQGFCCLIGGTTPPSCFPAGTKVSMAGQSGTTNIEDVKVGDKVISESENGQKSVSTVAKLQTPVSDNLCEIKYINGDKLDLTKNHPIFTSLGWKAIDPDLAREEIEGLIVSQLKIGDMVKKSDDSFSTVSSFSCKSETIQTYNLSLEGENHTYFADNFLVHNKGGGCTSGYAALGGCCDGHAGVCSVGCIGSMCSCDENGNNCGTTVCCDQAAQYLTAVCGSNHWDCQQGATGWINYEDPTFWEWWCLPAGHSGGGNTGDVLCYEPKFYQNGVCAATHYNCGSIGSSYYKSDEGDRGDRWVWRCYGYNGGVTAMCTEMKCDANTWGAWSVCDGNTTTQSRTNACGTVQSVACPQVGWWQVKDADIASNGDVISKAPPGIKFSLDGPGGFPGVVSYTGTANFRFGGGTVGFSTTNWLAQTSTASTKIYDSKYFANQIPADTVINDSSLFATLGGIPSHGYYWYKFDGSSNGMDFIIESNINLGNKKVVLLIDSANLYIRGKINLTKGQGFFMTIVGKNDAGTKGNIIIDPSVGGGITVNLEGIYLADGAVMTGTNGNQTDSILIVRGSVAGYGGIYLQRNIGSIISATWPSEYFEYAPDQIMLFPSVFGVRRMNWKEVAP